MRIELNCTEPQAKFHALECRYPLFVGGYGCVRENTLVATQNGYVEIADLRAGDDVLSWNESDRVFQRAPTSGAFPKGKANLLRVITTQGEFVASEYHRVRVPGGAYRPLANLGVGNWLSAASQGASTTKTPIICIERQRRKEWYWDMHVAGNNNYITKDGIIHHNSGKTAGMIDAAFMDASHAKDALIAIYEPTFDLIDLTVAPRLLEKLDEYKILHTHNKAKHKIVTYGKNNYGQFIMRSLDNPDKIVSYESYRAHIDELDTVPFKKAEQLWNRIIGRNRQIPSGFTKDTVLNRVSVYTTPEGFNFAHKRWVQLEDKENEYQLVRASSLSNPFLPMSYINSLKNTYTAELQIAYINGEFVNLTSGTVYKYYNRVAHNSTEQIKPKEPLFIGLDFNVTRMAATIYCKRQGGCQWHALAELVDVLDTPDMVRIIKEKYKDNGHRITIYPDASGSSRKAVNANVSDIALLHQAGFEVRCNPSNPAVRDRVNAMNAAFSKGAVFVNARNCPTVANCLEHQCWDKNGEPDKQSGFDHQNDASSYPIAYEMPIHKPIGHINIRF